MSDKSNEYPKTLSKKGDDHSIVLNKVRVYFDVVTANDADEEGELKKEGWLNSVEEAFKPKRKKSNQAKGKGSSGNEPPKTQDNSGNEPPNEQGGSGNDENQEQAD